MNNQDLSQAKAELESVLGDVREYILSDNNTKEQLAEEAVQFITMIVNEIIKVEPVFDRLFKIEDAAKALLKSVYYETEEDSTGHNYTTACVGKHTLRCLWEAVKSEGGG